jgi:ribosomal protein S18 acetylase RimI-like enzyme
MKIINPTISQSAELFKIYREAKVKLESNGIFQWTDSYPTLELIQRDLELGELYALEKNNTFFGAINLGETQEEEYKQIDWKFNHSNILVIHRLVVHPSFQGEGFGNKLMTFAEDFAKQNGYSSIRLDTYSQNEKAVNFYRNRNYVERGTINFPKRKHLFYCMEKELSKRL